MTTSLSSPGSTPPRFPKEELFRKAFEEGPLGMAIVGLDYRLIEVNDNLCRLLGYSRPELLERTFPEITHQADIDTDLRLAEQLFKGEIPFYRVRKRYLHKNGGVIWSQISASVIRDRKGRALYGLAMVEDISEQKRIEEDLRVSEERFRSFAEKMDVVSWITEVRPEKVLFVNRAFERIWGRSPQELYADAKIWMSAIHQEDRRHVAHRYENWLAGETAEYTVDYRIVRPDGQVRWISDQGFKLYDPQGNVNRVCGLATDITERKLATQAAEQARTELQDLLENAPLAMLISEGAEQRVFKTNRLFRKVIGYNREEMPDIAHWWPLAYPDPAYREEIRSLWESRMQEAMDNRREMEPVEAKIRCRDGRQRTFECHATSIGHRHLIIFVDLTEVRRLEKQVREAEVRFRSSFQAAPIGMALVSPTGKWLQVNKVLCDLLGYSEEKMLKITFQDLTHPDDLEKDLARLRELQDGTREAYVVEKRYLDRDGRIIWILLSVSAVRDEQGKVLYFISQIQDITSRKRIETEREDLIEELREALAKVKVLSGLLPICASCKNIRDDQGYWNQIESFISAHSEAEFSHSVCPACAKKLYPELYDRLTGSRNKKKHK